MDARVVPREAPPTDVAARVPTGGLAGYGIARQGRRSGWDHRVLWTARAVDGSAQGPRQHAPPAATQRPSWRGRSLWHGRLRPMAGALRRSRPVGGRAGKLDRWNLGWLP